MHGLAIKKEKIEYFILFVSFDYINNILYKFFYTINFKQKHEFLLLCEVYNLNHKSFVQKLQIKIFNSTVKNKQYHTLSIQIQNPIIMVKIKQIIFSIVLISLMVIIKCDAQHKCHPNSNMKYQLNYTYQLKGYHSLCSQFSKRTCCSGKNFQALAKKISTKLIGQGSQLHSLSHMCRRKLTTLLCSTCDGDIGQKVVEGVCNSVCLNVYQQCKDDFFSIDSLNKIKVCRDDDIICSKLSDIIPNPSNANLLCQMFGIQTDQHDCWNGIPSWRMKGVPKRKTNYHVKPTRTKKQPHFETAFDYLFKIQKKYWVYIGLLGLSLAVLAYSWVSKKLKNQARKIKNL